VCRNCALVQLGTAGPPAIDEQGVVESATAIAHARRAVQSIMREEDLQAGNTIIEIDSGHGGSWLPGFVEAGLIARDPDSTADLFVDVHGLMHKADLDAAVAAQVNRIAPGGRLICEFYYLGALVEVSLIDTIRHGHYSYLSLVAGDARVQPAWTGGVSGTAGSDIRRELAPGRSEGAGRYRRTCTCPGAHQYRAPLQPG
jgi:hypothetical protein